ncbi:MAG TPA: peptidoglycan-binding protein [Methylocystis sp.]|jgi:hypothetical protein
MKPTDLVPIPSKINVGIEPAGNRFMLAALGNPRSSYSANCQPVTNRALAALMVTRNVGPFMVSGYKPAVESLVVVLADIKAEQPEIYALLGTAGMSCARLVRGSASAISNHSWGTAIDLKIGGQLDARGNGRVQYGLTLIAPIFNRHGWYWGAGFGVEDGMHFECGRALISSFIGAKATPAVDDTLDIGDRGPAVVELQRLLNARGEHLGTDGIFGAGTRAALIAFQASNGLKADGVATAMTVAKLRGA